MSELTKYDILVNDLSSIESQISMLITRVKELTQKNADLEELLQESKKENVVLSHKIVKLQGELEHFQQENGSNVFNSLNVKEKEELKIKIQEIISRINFHLSADRQA